MRFSILKKWSHIIHRRGRSDSQLHFLQSTQVDYPRSSSVANLNIYAEQLHIPTVTLNLSSSPLSSSTSHAPRPSQACLSSSASPSTPRPFDFSDDQHPQMSQKTTTSVADRIAIAKRRLSELEMEKDSLDSRIRDLKDGSKDQQQRLDQIKQDLQSSSVSCQTGKDRTRERKFQAQRDHHRQLFAKSLLELGISNISEVGMFLDASEEEIVDAVLKAAERDDSVWCSVSSEIIGPLAPENYVSAVNIALNTRKELRSVKKVANFWKRTANGSDTVTPSASNISDVQEPLSLERRQAVEMLQRNRRGFSINSSVPERTFLPSISVSSEISTVLPYMLSTHSVSSVRKTESLPPLASQVFKEELTNAHASSSFFVSSSSKHIFKPKSNTIVEHKSVNSKRLSPRALGKQKAFSSADSSGSISQSRYSTELSALRSTVGRLKGNFLPDLELPSPITGILVNEGKVVAAPESTFLQAERALHSFERICNSFPSSNFSSLQAINEELTQEENQDINDDTLVNATYLGSNHKSIASFLTCELSVREADSMVVEATEVDKSEEYRLPTTAKCEANRRSDIRLADSCAPNAASMRASFTLPSALDRVDTLGTRLRPRSGSFVDIPQIKSVAPLKIVKKNRRASLPRNSPTQFT